VQFGNFLMHPAYIDMSGIKDTSLPHSVLEATLDLWSQAGQHHFFQIVGSSMFPLLQEGDQVLVRHCSTEVQRGDIIVFRQGDATIAHRVVHIRKSVAGVLFIAKGDNVPQSDPPVNVSAIVGRVVAVKRGTRFTSLEIPVWRISGKVIAGITIVSEQSTAWSHIFKYKFLGPQPNRVTAFLRRNAQAFFSFTLRVVRALAGRWE
jgi:signal peptidase I